MRSCRSSNQRSWCSERAVLRLSGRWSRALWGVSPAAVPRASRRRSSRVRGLSVTRRPPGCPGGRGAAKGDPSRVQPGRRRRRRVARSVACCGDRSGQIWVRRWAVRARRVAGRCRRRPVHRLRGPDSRSSVRRRQELPAATPPLVGAAVGCRRDMAMTRSASPLRCALWE